MNAVSFLDFNDAAPQGRAQPASLDREAILSRAKMQLEPLLQMLFPHGKRRGREFVVGNLQGEPGDSLCVALEGARAGIVSGAEFPYKFGVDGMLATSSGLISVLNFRHEHAGFTLLPAGLRADGLRSNRRLASGARQCVSGPRPMTLR